MSTSAQNIGQGNLLENVWSRRGVGRAAPWAWRSAPPGVEGGGANAMLRRELRRGELAVAEGLQQLCPLLRRRSLTMDWGVIELHARAYTTDPPAGR